MTGVYYDNNEKDGGAMRDRTADLLDANQALSQLSYGPRTPLATGRGIFRQVVVREGVAYPRT